MMIFILSIFILIVLAMIACVGIGLYFFQRAVYAHSKKTFILSDPHTRVTKEDQWYLQSSKYTTVSIQSKDGLTLHGSMIYHQCDRWVVLVHGYMGRLEDLIPQAQAFYERGYSVLLMDLRGHGKSEGDVIGFGYLDHLDVLSWMTFLKQKGAKSFLLYGVSMGASTVMLCADKVQEDVCAIIEDCGYATLRDQLLYIVEHMVKKVPAPFLVWCLSLVMKGKGGYRIPQVNCLKSVSQSKVPMLFLHGERDGFIQPEMMETLYQACPTKKQKILIPKARHANASKVNPELYWQAVDQFLNTI